MKAKAYRKTRIALGILLGFFMFLFALGTSLLIANAVTDRYARTLPSYKREDITALIEKEEWTEEDYRTIFLQAGVGRSAADALKAQGDAAALLLFQEELFFEGVVKHEFTEGTVTTLNDQLFEADGATHHYTPFVPLENGDVIVTSGCHTYGWRNGHAELVVDEPRGIIESVALGMPSEYNPNGAAWFQKTSNFIVLRLKNASAEERSNIARAAKENLLDIDYSLTVGLFSPKDQCKDGRTPTQTNCAHLVWQAYKNFGYDIDATGGPVVTVHDIARSDLFEVVQVNGFDPTDLW